MVKPFLSENACFFQNRSTIIVSYCKACGLNDAECLFMAYFTCQAHTQKNIYRGFNFISIKFLVKSKMSAKMNQSKLEKAHVS